MDVGLLTYRSEIFRGFLCVLIFFFFFFEHRLSTPVGTPNLSMQVKIQPTYLTLGVDFCV